MAKTDVTLAFRLGPIHPNDYSLLNMKWQNLFYFDRCLSMGCCSSCAIFEAFSTALEWLAVNRVGASGVLHNLDVFLFIAASEEKYQSAWANFKLCKYLGVSKAQEKTIGPETVLQFVGITLNSVTLEAKLPDYKLQKCFMLLHAFYKPRKVSLLKNCSRPVLRLLKFTCSVTAPGRAFVHRMLDRLIFQYLRF